MSNEEFLRPSVYALIESYYVVAPANAWIRHQYRFVADLQWVKYSNEVSTKCYRLGGQPKVTKDGGGRRKGGGGRDNYNFVAMIWFRTTNLLNVCSLGLLKGICTVRCVLA
jgi:hypothetical protein